MARALVSTVALFAMVAAANAEPVKKSPQPKTADSANNSNKADKADKSKKKTGKAAPAKRINLRAPTPPTKAGAPTVDLFPTAVFGADAPGKVGGRAERRSGLSLGNDGNWKVQAAQIGAMAVGWAALVGLCGGGKCLLPDALSGWIPDAFKAKPQVINQLRKPQKIRQAR